MSSNVPQPQGHLPARKDKRAPSFKGKNVDDYISALEELSKTYNVPETELPGAVRRYASKRVLRTIVAEQVFDGNDWKAAKEKLQLIYESLNDKYETSPRRLRLFAAEKRADDFVTSRDALDDYYRQFLQYAGTMVSDGRMTEQEHDNLFFSGLPKKLCHAILPELMSAVKARLSKAMGSENPPTMIESLAAARTYFTAIDLNSKTSRITIMSDSDDSDSSSDSSSSSSSCSSDEAARTRRSKKAKRKEKRKKAKKSRDRAKSESDSEEVVLRRKVNQLEQKLKYLEASDRPDRPSSASAQQQPYQYPFAPYPNQVRSFPQPPNAQFSSYPPQQASVNYGSAYGVAKRCWMCGQSEGSGLVHPIGMRNCPETHKLIQEQIIAYNQVNGRLCRASDGAELPAWHQAPNGIATLLREEIANSGRPQAGRDLPPHMSSAHAHSIGVLCDGEPVFSYDDSSSAKSFFAFPVSTRSQAGKLPQAGKTVRFTEVEDDDDGPSIVAGSAPPRTSTEIPRTAPTPAPVQPSLSRTPPRVNTEDGWKDASRDRPRGDASFKNKFTSKPYRFTSDVQDSVSVTAIEDHLLTTKVSLTLRELLGIAPSLQKRFASLVKTRREPDVKVVPNDRTTAAASYDDATAADTSLEASVSFDGSETTLTELVDRYAASLALGCPRTFAMVSGLVKGAFGDQLVTYLIDTGSELNIINRDVWESSKLTINEDGARWSLRGLGGQPVPLLGCVVDAAVQVGGRNFDHHFFVSSAPSNGVYGGILGQPWLSYFCAQIQYESDGETVLTVYPSSSHKGGAVSVTVCRKNHPRNALVLTSEVVSPGTVTSDF